MVELQLGRVNQLSGSIESDPDWRVWLRALEANRKLGVIRVKTLNLIGKRGWGFGAVGEVSVTAGAQLFFVGHQGSGASAMFEMAGGTAWAEGLVGVMDWPGMARLAGTIRDAVPDTLMAAAAVVIKQTVGVGQLAWREHRPLVAAEYSQPSSHNNHRPKHA